MRNLLVVSNHPPEKWEEAQKVGWDRIDYIPFPNIDPRADRVEINEIAEKLIEKIKKWLFKNYNHGKLCLQGEFTLCYIIFNKLHTWNDIFVFPTTERVVEEKLLPDGSIEKVSKFRFVRWR